SVSVFARYSLYRDLHSFPTRRSSDLVGVAREETADGTRRRTARRDALRIATSGLHGRSPDSRVGHGAPADAPSHACAQWRMRRPYSLTVAGAVPEWLRRALRRRRHRLPVSALGR